MPHIPVDTEDSDGFAADRHLIDALTEHGVLPWDVTPDNASVHAVEHQG
jgi:hypothetical protein